MMWPADQTEPTPSSRIQEPAASPADGRNDRSAGVALLFVALFAFFLASFPARNAEVWGHLAAGRDLVHGRTPTAVASWAPDRQLGQGWLFDLAAYATYSAVGGAGLVAVKALLIAGLAVLLLRLSRTGPGWLVPTVCTGLAVLAMGSRLLLQPVTVSYLFLGLALWLTQPRGGPASYVPTWPLVLLFLVWSNMDRWFVLGLGAVALVWGGRAIDEAAGNRVQALIRRAAALLVLAAACLVSPAPLAGFAVPPELTAAGPVPGGSVGVRSPFAKGYWEAMAESPVGLAYFPLLGLSLLSFLLALPRWRWARFLPWAALAALSAYQVRTVPFFAVVAGPVLAWNLRDFFARRHPAREPGLPGSRYVRALSGGAIGVIGLAFLASAWVGWLQSPPFEPRRWAIETPPALERSAGVLCAWKAEGRLPPDVEVLHLSADTAAAFAWFCPDVGAVRDPAVVAGVLGAEDAPGDWFGRMRAGVSHLIVYDTDRARWYVALERLLTDPREWQLLHVDGRVTVFVWRDPAAARPVGPGENASSESDRRALRPGPAARAPAAPAATPRRWWETFWKPAPRPTGDRDEAAVRLLQADAARRAAPPRHVAAWETTQVAGLVGAAGAWGGPGALLDAGARLVLFRPPVPGPGGSPHPLIPLGATCYQAFVRGRDDAPLGLHYLAIRAARRAVSQDPNDAQAHANLGEAYLRLTQNTRERAWGQPLAELVSLRRSQAAAAFHRALAIDPDQLQAHSQLGTMYLDMGFLDLALQHQRAFLAAVRRSGRARGAQGDALREAVAEAERQLEPLARTVEDREHRFGQESAGLRVLDRAVLARDRGLAGRARDILLNSDISAFGASGLALELELLIRTGRAQEVRDWTSPEQQEALGTTYHWLRVQALAASGDYASAQAECALLATAGDEPGGRGARIATAVLAGQELLNRHWLLPDVARPAWDAFRRSGFNTRLRHLVTSMRREADALTLRGLIALEAGETEAAAADFRQALSLWGGPAAVATGEGLDFNGRPAAQGALAWIESVLP